MKLLSFGEILWDVYPDKAVIGGASLNFAGHFALHDGDAYMISAVGNDELGASAIETCEQYSIKTKYVKTIDMQTGKCLVTLGDRGIPSYNLLNNVAYDYIGDEVEEEFDVFYFGTLAIRNEHNRLSLQNLLERNSFKEIFCDVNIRPPYYSADTVKLCFENATVIKISDEELPVINDILFQTSADYSKAAKEIAKRYKNLKVIIITLGPKGAFVLNTKTGEEYEMPAPEEKVVSTVGAGDSFSASFMYKYMSGKNIEECLAHAIKVSTFVVANLEAIPKYPNNFK